MIDASLMFLKTQLNSHIGRVTDVVGEAGEDKVVFLDGEKSDPIAFKLGAVTLVMMNVEEERVLRPADRYLRAAGADGVLRVEPELRLELSLLFAARFKAYDQSLKYISMVIQYFQSKPIFEPGAFPDLDPAIQRLTLELMPLPFSQQNDLWNALRATYLPSVLYRMRMLVFADEAGSAGSLVSQPVVKLHQTGGATR